MSAAKITDLNGNEMLYHGKKLNYDKVKPRLDLVMVRIDKPIKKSVGGINLPVDPKRDEYFRKGTVVRVGPGLYNNAGDIIELDIKPGDRVLVPQHTGSALDNLKLEENDQLHILVKHGDIFAILEPGAEVAE